MKLIVLSAIALSLAVPAAAADTAASALPKLGSVITTADGKRLGRVDDIHQATKKEAASVGIIYDGHFIFVPVSTLTAADKGYTTSLSLKEALGK
jgi:hypothetical protein